MPGTHKKKSTGTRPRVRRGNKEDAEAMRVALLDAAATLFAEGGLDAVSVRAVAGRVGVSMMTPYRYFADKNELLGGLLRAVYAETSKRMETAVAMHTGARDRLRASMAAFFAYWEENPDHYRLVFLTEQNTRHAGATADSSHSIYAEILAEQERLCVPLAEAIGAGREHVRLACDVRRAMALGFLYAMHVNRRYPWSDRKQLCATYVEQTLLAMERCLLDGPPAAGPA
ncbi:MAG TPA: TetR/AcrR family transcriptional regulator [Burkholderiaceae bacterium]|jgi:AcrR family transcriptional regulator